jgi:hypothetical protein
VSEVEGDDSLRTRTDRGGKHMRIVRVGLGRRVG